MPTTNLYPIPHLPPPTYDTPLILKTLSTLPFLATTYALNHALAALRTTLDDYRHLLPATPLTFSLAAVLLLFLPLWYNVILLWLWALYLPRSTLETSILMRPLAPGVENAQRERWVRWRSGVENARARGARPVGQRWFL